MRDKKRVENAHQHNGQDDQNAPHDELCNETGIKLVRQRGRHEDLPRSCAAPLATLPALGPSFESLARDLLATRFPLATGAPFHAASCAPLPTTSAVRHAVG